VEILAQNKGLGSGQNEKQDSVQDTLPLGLRYRFLGLNEADDQTQNLWLGKRQDVGKQLHQRAEQKNASEGLVDRRHNAGHALLAAVLLAVGILKGHIAIAELRFRFHASPSFVVFAHVLVPVVGKDGHDFGATVLGSQIPQILLLQRVAVALEGHAVEPLIGDPREETGRQLGNLVLAPLVLGLLGHAVREAVQDQHDASEGKEDEEADKLVLLPGEVLLRGLLRVQDLLTFRIQPNFRAAAGNRQHGEQEPKEELAACGLDAVFPVQRDEYEDQQEGGELNDGTPHIQVVEGQLGIAALLDQGHNQIQGSDDQQAQINQCLAHIQLVPGNIPVQTGFQVVEVEDHKRPVEGARRPDQRRLLKAGREVRIGGVPCLR